MIFIIICIIILICIYFNYKLNIDKEHDYYTCGVTNIDERAVGLKKTIFKPGQTVYLAFEGKEPEKIKTTFSYLKEYAFPFINLNFKIGRTGDSIIRIQVEPPKDIENANITGNTYNIGTKKPTIKLFKLTQGTTLHEFGHALGMTHEHQNPSLSNPIKFNLEKTYAFYIDKKWDKKKINEQIINKKNAMTNLYTKYDPYSIMNYKLSNNLLQAPVQIFRGQEYSDGDKEWFKLKYGPVKK